jgi:hypothetical protein
MKKINSFILQIFLLLVLYYTFQKMYQTAYSVSCYINNNNGSGSIYTWFGAASVISYGLVSSIIIFCIAWLEVKKKDQ